MAQSSLVYMTGQQAFAVASVDTWLASHAVEKGQRKIFARYATLSGKHQTYQPSLCKDSCILYGTEMYSFVPSLMA